MSAHRDRDRFLAAVYTAPLVTADAIVLFAGEDNAPRLAAADALFRSGTAPLIYVTGRASTDGPHVGTPETATALMAKGLSPTAIDTDAASAHTGEQASTVVRVASERGWRRVLLVASAYHLPRAMLTVAKAIGDGTLCVVPVAAAAPWAGTPDGMTVTRMQRFDRELEKCESYDDCASWAQGWAYLKRFEGGQ